MKLGRKGHPLLNIDSLGCQPTNVESAGILIVRKVVNIPMENVLSLKGLNQRNNVKYCNKILKIVNKYYPDNMIRAYHNMPDADHGDGLAKFLVNEIKDLSFGTESYDEAKTEVTRGLVKVKEEIEKVLQGLVCS